MTPLKNSVKVLNYDLSTKIEYILETYFIQNMYNKNIKNIPF